MTDPNYRQRRERGDYDPPKTKRASTSSTTPRKPKSTKKAS